MTHSLHRLGSVESLRGDYVLLCTPAKGVNDQDSAWRLARILDILMDIGPANIGFYGHGSLLGGINMEEVKAAFHNHSRLRCCFDSRGKIKEALRRIKEEDLGLSITVSGLISELQGICSELSLTPHTINLSCGCFGKVERLPQAGILEISTMCGHGMISFQLVENTVARLREGTIAFEAAVGELAGPCTCGIFNPTRAHDILHAIVEHDR